MKEEAHVLKIEHFSKTYPGGKRAVDDLNLNVAPGEIFGFIGHNGAGKTTTLRAVSGVMDFTEGSITIGGHDVRRDATAAKKITAFLPDNPDLYDFLTGVQYLNFIADLYDIPRKERQERAKHYLEMVGMQDRMTHKPDELSGGQKQRVSIARAMTNNPSIILADEPTGALDSKTGRRIMDIFHRLNQEEGKTIVLITHSNELAEETQRIVTLKDGEIIGERKGSAVC